MPHSAARDTDAYSDTGSVYRGISKATIQRHHESTDNYSVRAASPRVKRLPARYARKRAPPRHGSATGHNSGGKCYASGMENGTRATATRGAGSIVKAGLLGGGLLLGSQIVWAITLALMAVWLVGALFIMLLWVLVALLASLF